MNFLFDAQKLAAIVIGPVHNSHYSYWFPFCDCNLYIVQLCMTIIQIYLLLSCMLQHSLCSYSILFFLRSWREHEWSLGVGDDCAVENDIFWPRCSTWG